MKSSVQECRLVVRQLKPGAGLTESAIAVTSLDELFKECLALVDDHLLERVVITGHDGGGRRRALTFTFQSVADRD